MSSKKDSSQEEPAVSGILRGVSDLLEAISEVVTEGGEVERTGRFTIGKERKSGIYGIHISTQRGKSGFSTETFGMKKGGSVREPVVDIFDEEREVLVIVELPGIAEEEITVKREDEGVLISGGREGRRFERRIDLPEGASRNWTESYRNGLLTIRFQKE
ncbi:Hsp20/alpha crystallin family protein [Methanocalculus sp.]|uniref:Hsp20/alpha crystallin family protein n=1 Tax=Methanocalculus sp. TaxID=2004547 RepID=UPI0027282AA1|nr:Hsp20/alpha crystallin family protein [Methanocalculus sp.]MDO8841920.1 Hsp20/alpha crystallin family protein [Methanocalculus sp.]